MLNFLLAIAAFAAMPGVESAAQRSRAALDSLLQSTTIPAVSAAVAIEDELVFANARGLASIGDSIPANPTTRFGIGSITKTLTLTLVARLVDRGILDWDLPISTWLEDFPYELVSLRHIGAHQSGINDDRVSDLRFTGRHFDTEEAYREVVASALDFAPGSRTRYATGSFTVIAAVVEEVTGESFSTVLEREILIPAGMTRTTVHDPRQPSPGTAKFYDPREGELVPVTFDPSIKLAGAGYLSTPTDLTRFASALLNGRLCSDDQLAELFREQRDENGPTGFALGWRVTEDDGMTVLYQPGGGPGISGYVVIYPESGLAFAILCNETAGTVGGQAMSTTLDAFLGLLSTN